MGPSVILPNFILNSRINLYQKHTGIDSYDRCENKKHFKNYPHNVEYQYNSRGFRDQEWPKSIEELKNSIWCVGDSFTVGLGSPVEHTWPWLLQKNTGIRTINISMDGASNNWIARKTLSILQQINPQHLVVHWSYLHRRELDPITVLKTEWNRFYQTIKDPQWPSCDTQEEFDQLPESIRHEIITVHHGVFPVLQTNDQYCVSDEDRRCHYLPQATEQDDIDNTLTCISLVNNASTTTQLLHSFIPDFCQNAETIQQHLKQQHIKFIPEFLRLDRARDYHHYDIMTSEMFVNQIINCLDFENQR